MLTNAVQYGIVKCKLHLYRKGAVEIDRILRGLRSKISARQLGARPDFVAMARDCRDRNDAELIRLRDEPAALFSFICQYRATLARRGEAGRRVGFEKVQVACAGGKASRVEQKVRERQRDQAQAIIEYFEDALRAMGIDPVTTRTPGFIRQLQRSAAATQLSLPLTT